LVRRRRTSVLGKTNSKETASAESGAKRLLFGVFSKAHAAYPRIDPQISGQTTRSAKPHHAQAGTVIGVIIEAPVVWPGSTFERMNYGIMN
jgi:hypothetical protein